jgi:hypothetical protein
MRDAVTSWARARLTLSNVLSVVALFAALGGTAYAAVALPKNSVGAKQIKKNAVRTAEVKNRSLRAVDFRRGQLPRGPQGPQGIPGTQGIQGLQGERGTFRDITVQFEQATADLADGASQSYNVFCPDGQIGIAGGFRGDFDDSEATNVGSSRPAMGPSNTEPPTDGGAFTGWRITVLNHAGGVTTGIRPEVWVVCVTP